MASSVRHARLRPGISSFRRHRLPSQVKPHTPVAEKLTSGNIHAELFVVNCFRITIFDRHNTAFGNFIMDLKRNNL